MNLNCYQLSAGPQFSPCGFDDAMDALKHNRKKIWFDLQDADDAELEKTLDHIGVHGISRRFCIESRNHPGFYPIKPVSLMVIPVQMEMLNENDLEYLALLFSNDFLLTIRNSKMARFQKNITLEETIELLPDDSIAGIISSLIMGLSLDCLRKTSWLSDNIHAIEKRMENEPDSIHIEELSDRRSELQILESIVQGQLPIIESIVPTNKTSITSERTLEYLTWTAANLKSADRKLDWLEHRIEVMRSILDMRAQDRTNRRLGRLTVISMIFMPITFLAGIWGMNFEWMPGLTYKFGSVIAIGSMIIITAVMYFYFRKKGWFD